MHNTIRHLTSTCTPLEGFKCFARHVSSEFYKNGKRKKYLIDYEGGLIVGTRVAGALLTKTDKRDTSFKQSGLEIMFDGAPFQRLLLLTAVTYVVKHKYTVKTHTFQHPVGRCCTTRLEVKVHCEYENACNRKVSTRERSDS